MPPVYQPSAIETALSLTPLLVLQPLFLLTLLVMWLAGMITARRSAQKLTLDGEPDPRLLRARTAARVNGWLIVVNTCLGVLACVATYGTRGGTSTSGPQELVSSLLIWLAVIVLPFILATYLASVLYLAAAGRSHALRPPFLNSLLFWISASPALTVILWIGSIFAFISATYPGGMFTGA